MHQILPFYHTVYREPKPHFEHLQYKRSASRFSADLDFLTANFNPIEIHQIGRSKEGFHLSFDDGMSEIYDVIAPMLLDRKIPATFFITQNFVDNKELFISHKISLIADIIKNSSADREKAAAFLNCKPEKIVDTLYLQRKSIDALAEHLKISFQDYLQQYKPYCTMEQVKELKRMGFTIGNHSKTHRNFNTLNLGEQQEEILSVNKLLQDMNVQDLYFCFPYGDNQISNELFRWMYSDAGIEKSFGISGLKQDGHSRHFHRILMEHEDLSGANIIRSEYLLYALKSVFNRNKIVR